MNWRKLLYHTGNRAEAAYDSLKLKWRQRLGLAGNLQIQPYTSYASHTELFVKGRVLEGKSIVSAKQDSWLTNLRHTYERFNSNEITGARLVVTFKGLEQELMSDEDGYFETALALSDPLPADQLWHYPQLELIEAPVRFTPPVLTVGKVMTPPITASFGVISDIDDTILQTNATSLLQMLRLTIFSNAYTRLAFSGASAFYTALQNGLSGSANNPFFYVSGSPWNLYDFLVAFMSLNGIPEGPLFLKDYGFTHGKVFSEPHLHHKRKAIRTILHAYPHLPFILIGDSGQHDPEIYEQTVQEFPGRIACIYIRDVSLHKRDMEIKKIVEGLALQKVEMVFVENTQMAAEHALEKGFISRG